MLIFGDLCFWDIPSSCRGKFLNQCKTFKNFITEQEKLHKLNYLKPEHSKEREGTALILHTIVVASL